MYSPQGVNQPLNPSAPSPQDVIQQGYPQQGHLPQNYPQQGYPTQGYSPQGYPPMQSNIQQPGQLSHPHTSSPTESTRGMLSENDDWAGTSFTEKSIRQRFIHKVYVIVLIQLIFTAAVTLFFVFHGPTKRWVQAHSWIYYPSYIVFLIVYIILVCCKTARRKWPVNLICLIIFTLALTYMTGMISSMHDTFGVIVALGITVAVSIAISLFACQTKYDLTKCSGILLALVVALVISGIILGVWYFATRHLKDRKILHAVLGCIGGLLASLALAVNTQLLIGNKKNKLSPEEHIFGALEIYINITDIFQTTLCCMNMCSCC